MQKHHGATVTNYVYHMQARFLCDVISRSRNRLSEGEIRTLLKEYRRTRKEIKDKGNRHGAVGKSSSEQHFCKCAAITFIV